MSRFTVVWLKSANDQLAQIWLDASDRDEVSSAADRIEQVLASDPTGWGEEVHEGLRRLVVARLQVLYAIREPDRIVEVGRIKRV